MEQNKEMTAQESLRLITETMNNSRKEILRTSGKHLLFWGVLLTIFSLAIFLLWNTTDRAAWNYLWFAMPIVGMPATYLLNKGTTPVPESLISKMLGGVWSAYGIFAVCAAALACFVVPLNITVTIILLFGFSVSISGIILKNWAVIVSGFVLAMGGMFIGVKYSSEPAQLLIFVLGGIVLAVTGLIVKSQTR